MLPNSDKMFSLSSTSKFIFQFYLVLYVVCEMNKIMPNFTLPELYSKWFGFSASLFTFPVIENP